MTAEEKANIIALAKLAGVTGEDSDILDKYSEYYKATLESFKKQAPKPTVTVINRPF